MPTYEYRCATCGGRFETFQSITADALTTCTPELCQSENPEERGHGSVKRIVSGGAGVVFRGEGFYLTDYVRKKGGGDADGGGGGAKGKTSTGSGSESGTTGTSSGTDSAGSTATGKDSPSKKE